MHDYMKMRHVAVQLFAALLAVLVTGVSADGHQLLQHRLRLPGRSGQEPSEAIRLSVTFKPEFARGSGKV
jgi:hypothetical protein